MTAAAKLERTTLRTSRLLDFCSRKELIAQTGHNLDVWPLVVLKELVDNALDACEVRAHREVTGDVTDLYGYQARKARDELATTFAVALPGQETADPSVIKACSGLLDKRNT